MIVLLLAALMPIEEVIPDGAFSYPGKYKREIITFDPLNAPVFEQAYQGLKNQLDSQQSDEEILLLALSYAQRELFDLSLCTNPQVLEMIYKNGQEEIPLDAFLREKKGVCRHLALCVTLLINRLVEEKILDGEVYLIREDLSWGRHAWTLLLTNEGAWHLDAYQGVFENGKTRAGFSNLCQKYGNDVMQRQKTRWKHDY